MAAASAGRPTPVPTREPSQLLWRRLMEYFSEPVMFEEGETLPPQVG